MHTVRNVCACDMCTIIATDLELVHPANKMASWARSERGHETRHDFGHRSSVY